MLSGTVSRGFAGAGVCASPEMLVQKPVAASARVRIVKRIEVLLSMKYLADSRLTGSPQPAAEGYAKRHGIVTFSMFQAL
jgi:hypothetical protein